MNEAQFRQQLREQGYSEAQSLEYELNSANDGIPNQSRMEYDFRPGNLI